MKPFAVLLFCVLAQSLPAVVPDAAYLWTKVKKSISEFHKEPDWIRVEKETEAGGKLRSGVTAYRLTPTDFCKLR